MKQIVFDANNDQGAPDPKEEIEKQRAAIKVEVAESDKDKNDDDVNDSSDDDKSDDGDDNNDDSDENETAEQKTARIVQEKEDRRQSRIQKRIDKLTATVGNKDTEIAELKKQLAEKPIEGLTEEEVERRANKKAKELA